MTARGHAENRRVADRLAARELAFDRYWVSPYARAQQTAQDVLQHYQAAEPEVCNHLTPETKPDILLNALDAADGDSFLLIGHNPLVSRFAAMLLGENAANPRYFATSELIAIEAEVVAPACGVLKYTLIP